MTLNDRKLAKEIYGDAEVQKGLKKLNRLLRGTNISIFLYVAGKKGKVYGRAALCDSRSLEECETKTGELIKGWKEFLQNQ